MKRFVFHFLRHIRNHEKKNNSDGHKICEPNFLLKWFTLFPISSRFPWKRFRKGSRVFGSRSRRSLTSGLFELRCTRTLLIRPGDEVLLMTAVELFVGDVDIGFTVTKNDALNIFCYRKRILQKDFKSVAELNCQKYSN